MGKHTDYVKGTAAHLRRIATEAGGNLDSATDAVDAAEDRTARDDARERADLAQKFPQLDRR